MKTIWKFAQDDSSWAKQVITVYHELLSTSKETFTHLQTTGESKDKHTRPRQDSNLQPADSKSDALSVRPQGQREPVTCTNIPKPSNIHTSAFHPLQVCQSTFLNIRERLSRI